MMIAVGDKHFINRDYIIEILYPVDRRANKMARTAAGNRRLINAAGGDRIRSIIKLKSKFTVLSALEVKTLKSKIKRTRLSASSGTRSGLSPKPQKTSARESKPSGMVDRRIGPDRRKYSYTCHIPERRSGAERRRKY
jgi:regulator of extracellular matrix RemA (YlzA/DUF370 family)